jgi:2-octaprenyl-6-methoxyphenol hydroxylase
MNVATANPYDIAIVGGGLVGASLAAALRGSGKRIALIEPFAPDSAAQPSFDERTTALGNASRRVFEALGLWKSLRDEAAPITRIHVSDAGRYGFARLEAAEFDQEALGYVVPNRVLGRVLWAALAASPDIDTYLPAHVAAVSVGPQMATLQVEREGGSQRELVARLIVAADGATSVVRTAMGLGATVEDYHQVAVVTSVRTDKATDGIAYERFTAQGPMALLPLAGAAGWRTLVWAAKPEAVQALLALEDASFIGAWQSAFGWRAGRAISVSRRAAYPLALTRAQVSVAPRVALLGNASQALHPVAGQGFNLGLRDAAELAELLHHECDDVGAPALLEQYAQGRVDDRDGVVRFTDTLVRLFSDDRPGIATARNAALLLFDLLPPAKRALSRVSLGFGRSTPRLARGLPF